MMLRQRSGGGGRGREGDDDESGNGGWKRVSNWLLRRQTWFAGTDTDNQNGMPSRRYIIIHPENRWYAIWAHFILVWAVYSSFFTPMEFGFFRGLPENLFLLDIAGQFAFLVDIVLHFLVAYRDKHTYRIVYNRNLIAIRYLKSRFCIDLLGCMPWDAIFKACGRKEALRYLLWIRISRAVRVTEFFEKLEKDIRINYLFTRIVKLLVVELYCTHTAACIFYYLATTLPAAEEGYTWIGSLQMGDYHYSHFRDIDLWKRYITSLYFAIVTMATVGYGEIHAVNVREMIFVMVYVSFDMVLGAYLLGNMTALIVKGSKTEKFRDKMDDVIKYMNINNLGRATSNEIKNHLRLQYDLKYTQATILRDLPASIHTKISVKLYEPFIKETPLFKGCSPEFIKHIAIKVHEEFFFPGEVIIEQGNVVDQLYIVCHGELEEIGKEENEETEESSLVHLEACNSFGEVSFLCNSPYPYTIQAKELCKVLRLDKQSFLEMIGIYFSDGRTILNNLLEGKKNIRKEMLESNVSLCIEKSESQVIMSLNCVAYDGDYYRLKRLIEAGANPNKADYNGRSPLHVAASKGHVDITRLLIEKAVDINISDKFGNSPLLEAIKGGHEEVASLLVMAGALLEIDDLGNFLCTIVAKRDLNLLRRLLDHGVNPNAKNYDSRTPLHIAASEGLYSMVNLLLDAGATVFSRDRWDKTPIDDARLCGDKKIIQLIEVVRVSD